MSTETTSPSNGAHAAKGANGKSAVNRLQRGILRLALSYHGQDSQLDSQLKKLGILSRGDGSESDRLQLIDDIVEAVIELKARAEPAQGDASSELLLNFLDNIDIPEPFKTDLERNRVMLEQARGRSAMLDAVAKSAASLSTYLSAHNGGEADDGHCRTMLLDLLERMPVAKASVGDLAPLRREIEKAQDTAHFQRCVGGIVKLVQSLQTELQAEVKDLEVFIKRVAARLSDFDRFVNKTSQMHASSADDALQLSDTIEIEVKEIRADVANCDSIDQVREMVEGHLSRIDDGLETFSDAQRAQERESKQVFDQMTGKLRELESQTESLRQDLETQRERVVLDPLTGVFNRSGYDEMAAKHVARWKRYGGKLSMAVIDLDHFKKINDQYGHAAGDRVLATVANRISEIIRESDVLCRYGGEEFVLILPETGIDNAGEMIEKLRLDIAECPFRYKDEPVAITLSCGVSQFNHGDSLEDVFERADKAMYQAKSSGRNQSCAVDSNGARLSVAA